MAPDFSAAWQCLSKRTIDFLLRIKLHEYLGTYLCLRSFASSGTRSLCQWHQRSPWWTIWHRTFQVQLWRKGRWSWFD
jgi:hypothetical protein